MEFEPNPADVNNDFLGVSPRRYSRSREGRTVSHEVSAPSPLIKGVAFALAAYALYKTRSRLRCLPDEVRRYRRSRLLRFVFWLEPSGSDEKLLRFLRRRYLFVVFCSTALLATILWDIASALFL